MRLSGLLVFGALLIFGIVYGYPLGSFVFGCVLFTTVWVHRPRRVWTRGIREDVDYAAVGMWFVYNACLFSATVVGVVVHGGTRLTVGLLFASVMGAVCTVVINRWRNQYAFRSGVRDVLHVTMHVTGALGTLCLLVANHQHNTHR